LQDDPGLRERLIDELRRVFPKAEVVDKNGEFQVLFVLVDYVPGCAPKCETAKSYRNWTGEVMTWIPAEEAGFVSYAMVFGVEGSTYNPRLDPAKRFATDFAKFIWR
jgi:hypothetical protein